MNHTADAQFISHDFRGAVIPQRPEDGYINATAMCAAEGKSFYGYSRLDNTKAFLEFLSLETQICVSKLVQVIRGRGDRVSQGTWVHPYVAINLAQWLSPAFAVQVSMWVFEWLGGFTNSQSSREVPVDHPDGAMTPLNVPQALAMVGMALEISGKAHAAEVWRIVGLPVVSVHTPPDESDPVRRSEPRAGTDEARILQVIRDAGEGGVVRSVITRRFRAIRAVDIDDILDGFERAGLIRRVAAASAAIRQGVDARGGTPVIRARKNLKRLEPIAPFAYALRNRMERAFNRLKNARRFATRYDKTSTSYLRFVHIVSARIWVRSLST